MNYNAATKDAWVEATYLNETNIRFLMETDATYRAERTWRRGCCTDMDVMLPLLLNILLLGAALLRTVGPVEQPTAGLTRGSCLHFCT